MEFVAALTISYLHIWKKKKSNLNRKVCFIWPPHERKTYRLTPQSLHIKVVFTEWLHVCKKNRIKPFVAVKGSCMKFIGCDWWRQAPRETCLVAHCCASDLHLELSMQQTTLDKCHWMPTKQMFNPTTTLSSQVKTQSSQCFPRNTIFPPVRCCSHLGAELCLLPLRHESFTDLLLEIWICFLH